ncbi:MAG TPA: cupin domain-containing protein [Verrucomicrobiae bacterium]|jgi:quercetin dioxygenase-like cupin family protein|nr:cupin domain-containing protein [Verrucomicrobiae bacterium]
MKIACRFALAALVLTTTLAASAQEQDKDNKSGVTTLAASKFGPLPGMPSCLSLSVQRGDPAKGAAVILIKMTPGCTVPWHWHTAGEALMMVSGKGKIEMKDAAASAVAPGDYVLLPGKHPHQFSCATACTFFDVTEGAFDVHYIDKDGKEIPPDQALGPAKKPMGKKK